MLRSCVAVLGVSEVATGSIIQSPLLPFHRDVFPFNVVLFEVCSQSVTDNSSAASQKTNRIFSYCFDRGGESHFWHGCHP